jgi:protein-tyrosine phosphatase
MIDLHAHVLPGVDDGPASMPAALALVEAAAAAGTSTIVATPHVDLRFGLEAGRIAASTSGLQAALDAAGVGVHVLSGAEIALERLIDLPPWELDALGLGGGPYLLVEAPLRRLPGEFDWPIRSLLEDGTRRVLIAHPERSPAFHADPARLVRLVDEGALCQVTTGAITGAFGAVIRDFALDLVRAGLVHDLASDAHDLARRPPGLGPALAALAAEGLATEDEQRWLTEAVPAAIIAGEDPPPRP